MAQPILAKQMDKWKLLPRPERMTELYFTDYQQLHPSIGVGTPQTVMFTVHNLEHQATTYHYVLSATSKDDAVERPLGDGKFTLAHDQSLAVSKQVVLPPIDKQLSIEVSLQYSGLNAGDTAPTLQKQSIHYWIPGPHAPGAGEERGSGV